MCIHVDTYTRAPISPINIPAIGETTWPITVRSRYNRRSMPIYSPVLQWRAAELSSQERERERAGARAESSIAGWFAVGSSVTPSPRSLTQPTVLAGRDPESFDTGTKPFPPT